MLIISELSEALEAHRKGRIATLGALQRIADLADDLYDTQPAYYATYFASDIKDSVGDELADAYIRLCDYAGGYQAPVKQLIAHKDYWGQLGRASYREPMEDVFGADLMQVVVAVVELDSRTGAEVMTRLSRAFDILEYFADHYKVDLATHIDLKLRYNATRPAKHGKAY